MKLQRFLSYKQYKILDRLQLMDGYSVYKVNALPVDFFNETEYLLVNKSDEVISQGRNFIKLFNNGNIMEIKKIPTYGRKCGYIPCLCFARLNNGKIQIINSYMEAKPIQLNDNVIKIISPLKKAEFLYDIEQGKQITPLFSSITDFEVYSHKDDNGNELYTTKIAMATKKIGEYEVKAYIDINGKFVSDLYDSFSKKFIDTQDLNFDFESYLINLQHLIETNSIVYSEEEIVKKLRKKIKF